MRSIVQSAKQYHQKSRRHSRKPCKNRRNVIQNHVDRLERYNSNRNTCHASGRFAKEADAAINHIRVLTIGYTTDHNSR